MSEPNTIHTPEALSFEAAMARLEVIVKAMDFTAEPPGKPRRQQKTSKNPVLIGLLFQWEMGKPDNKQGNRQISFRS